MKNTQKTSQAANYLASRLRHHRISAVAVGREVIVNLKGDENDKVKTLLVLAGFAEARNQGRV